MATADRGALDRAAGALAGLAYGDALGVPYEYGSRRLHAPPQLLGGGLGGYEPGEWSDDTQLAICIAQAAAEADLTAEEGLDAVATRFEQWFAAGPADVGIQTAQVMRDARDLSGSPARRLRAAAAAVHARTARTAGNGALMRTAPVAITLSGRPDAIAAAARAIAELTHPDPLAGDSCVLWCLAIDTALRRGGPPGEHSPAAHLDALGAQRRDQWAHWLAAAETSEPEAFTGNGFTVTALQAAWSAICRHGPGGRFLPVIHAAIAAGEDTDTVAAIAGSLAGASLGMTEVRDGDADLVHGWPGMDLNQLGELAQRLLPTT